MNTTRFDHFSLALLISVLSAGTANAACNLFPGSEKTFDASLGAVNRPFAAPGETVEVRLRPCDTSSTALPGGFADPADNYVATLLFTLSASSKNAVIMSTDCGFFTPAVKSACEALLPGGTAECVTATPADLDIVDRNNGDLRLSVRMPDTDARLSPDADDRGYAGPTTIAITLAGDPLPCQLATTPCKGQTGLAACIDSFYANDGACQKQVALATFGEFIALPQPNDFQIKCFDEVPPCDPQSPDEFRVALDREGNLFAPIDWRGILVRQAGIPVPRLLHATIGPSTVPITLPGKSFVQSYTPEGGLLPPIFEPQFDPESPSGVVNLFGSADAPYTILRVARRSDTFQQCAGGAYDGLPCNETADCPGACVMGSNPGARCADDSECTGGGTCGAAGSCGPTVCATGSRAGQPCNSHRNCPAGKCGPELFDVAALAHLGQGPVIVPRSGDGICQLETTSTCSVFDPCGGTGPCVNYAMRAENPVPLEGLEQSHDVFAFSLNEGIDGVPRNGDGDTQDTVVTLRDRDTGLTQPLGAPAGCGGISGTPDGRAIVRAHEAPFSFPAVATEGDVVAFLESETGSAFCAENGDGEADDSILRVFKRNPTGSTPTEVTASFAPALSAETALVFDDRSLAVSNGRVFFRSREDAATSRTTVRVSVDGNGVEGDALSELQITGKTLSDDGRFVTFNSSSNNWAPGDAGYRDVFVHDRDFDENGVYDETGPGKRRLIRASELPGPVNPSSSSFDQAISASGRYVVFATDATNLGASMPCTYGFLTTICSNIVLKDLETDTLETISVDSQGNPGNGDSRYTNVSSDGRFVVFQSNSTNLVANDTNTCPGLGHPDPGECQDIFLRDRCVSNGDPVAGCDPSTTLVSVAPSGTPFASASEFPTISNDGQFIAFQTYPGPSTYLHNRITGATQLVSHNGVGAATFGQFPVVSGDGNHVTFETTATLVPQDTNINYDAYIWQRATDTYDLASVDSNGIAGNHDSFYVSPSADGRYVAFASWAQNLVPGDTNTCDTLVIPGQCQDYFVRDRLAGVTRRVSLSQSGGQSSERAHTGLISGDGRFVAFLTIADLLDPPGDTNVYCDGNNDSVLENCPDVYVRTLDPVDVAGDSSGDGNVDDTILRALDSSTASLTALCPSTQASTVAGTIAFLRPENAGPAPNLVTPGVGVAGCPAGTNVTGGISLNGDGDHDDDVAHFWSGTGTVQSLSRAADDVEMTGLCTLGANDGTSCRSDADCEGGSCTATWIAALVSEEGQNATDLNDDGDSHDTVVQVHRVSDPPTTWNNVGQAGEELEMVGNLAVFLTPEADQDAKLNGDADKTDRVVQIYDAAEGRLTNPKQAAHEFVTGRDLDRCTEGPLVAFRTSEAEQGGADLNEDDDSNDGVLQVWSRATGLINTKQPVRPCRLEACDPRHPYRILGAKVKFLTFECDQGGTYDEMMGSCTSGADLNGDGDDEDLILQQFDACTRTVTVIGPVDGDSGEVGDPLDPEPDQPVLITKSGRCYAGATLLLVPASCKVDADCPAGSTCEEESVVGTFREITTRDVVLRPPKPLTIKIGAGDATIAKTLKVKIVSADPRGGQPIPVRLTAADGDCPPGTVVGLPDLDADTDGVQDTVMLAAAKTAKARVTLQIAAAAFTTHNGKAPSRCRLELSATIPLTDNDDPTPGNNAAVVELNVLDDNDTPSSSTHESVISSAKPLKLKIGSTGTATKNVKFSVINADILPAPEASHTIDITADDGDCPAGTVGAPVPASTLGGGGAKATVVVPVTTTAAAITTPNEKSAARCTAVITATTAVMGNTEPDASNNTTHLVIDFIDKTD